MNQGKQFVVDIFQEKKHIFTLKFNTRKELVSYLRTRGLAFRNDLLCNLGSDSVDLEGGYGDSYHIEEMAMPLDIIQQGGRTYIPVKYFALKTGVSRTKLTKWFQLGHLQGIRVGKYNRLYICTEQAVEIQPNKTAKELFGGKR